MLRNTITAGCRHSVALKSDWTVIAVGDNKYGQCDVSHWRDIMFVGAGNVHMANNTGNAHTIGLKSDGTVMAAGWDQNGQCNVKDWYDIIIIMSNIL